MKNKSPRILCLDFETLPIEAYVWGLYDQNISHEMVKSDFALASFAAKYVGEAGFFYKDNRNKRDPRDDRELVKYAQNVIAGADVIIGQNSLRFDLPKLNSRAYFHGLPPTRVPAKHVDLLKEGRRIFGHTSHKLAWISSKLDSSHQKSDHAKFPGIKLWLEVMNGNIEAWKEMEKYNKQDIVSTIEVFKEYMKWMDNVDLRPFFMSAPTTECRACGSENTFAERTVRRKAGRFRQYRCKECGCLTTMSGQKNNLDKHNIKEET